ncbi:hypothetical protein NDN08_006302 [Rhodosorus marinus]|uniref:Uncharacterized protein n=1 Tax=Rhodosorus marinus TaxID=101924 RepID=A0AAV8UKA4_9RHOD|nr:hypothetical protein NDN08_006302 [Rhodosorus marinus]
MNFGNVCGFVGSLRLDVELHRSGFRESRCGRRQWYRADIRARVNLDPIVDVYLDHPNWPNDSTIDTELQEDTLELLNSPPVIVEHQREISITLCDDPTIRMLNNQHLGKDEVTDVLSFPLAEEIYPEGDESRTTEKLEMLGDVVISLDTAGQQATDRSYELRDELRILLIHGLLHLLGFDHERSDEEYEAMLRAETTLLAEMNWKGPGLVKLAE